MPSSPLPLDRWGRLERVRKLRDVLIEYEAGRPLSGELLALLMKALARVLRDGESFESALGLSPPRGGRRLTITALHAELEGEGHRWVTVLHTAPGPTAPAGKSRTRVHHVSGSAGRPK